MWRQIEIENATFDLQAVDRVDTKYVVSKAQIEDAIRAYVPNVVRDAA
jgi:hypothetical protein